mmetsp:Transcript_149407/g.362891  ORF Transcript_149407/g.362891 Transcript_149407/m.362891 type:complete len:239 (-) Transcript_149407:357-1073(-)
MAPSGRCCAVSGRRDDVLGRGPHAWCLRHEGAGARGGCAGRRPRAGLPGHGKAGESALRGAGGRARGHPWRRLPGPAPGGPGGAGRVLRGAAEERAGPAGPRHCALRRAPALRAEARVVHPQPEPRRRGPDPRLARGGAEGPGAAAPAEAHRAAPGGPGPGPPGALRAGGDARAPHRRRHRRAAQGSLPHAGLGAQRAGQQVRCSRGAEDLHGTLPQPAAPERLRGDPGAGALREALH